MAPPKTMAISQQQQQTSARQADQTSKARKRKGKQNSTQQAVASVSEQKQQVSSANASGKVLDDKENQVREASIETSEKTDAALALKDIVTIKLQQQQANQVSSPRSQAKETANSSPVVKKKSEPIAPIAATQTVLAKQISTDEVDEIDAGIELDGSSNSGSSVKDLNEDQIKSASVSPVMVQSNIVNENRSKTKHAREDAPLEQVAGSLCTDIAPSSKKITTKQQLAANLQVIDADEQQLQRKLQISSQRKPSAPLGTTASLSGGSSNGPQVAPQSPALCKVCDQHVYQMERMMAEKAVYHKSCFKCYQCKIQLRVDNYSSHEGQVYCKAHHRQLFQPQVKLNSEDDVDIVAKSNARVVDDYLLHRGRLSDLSFSFLQPKQPEGIRKRQMIICENEPAELPKDVVRSDTKVDDGIESLNLNLNNILEKFEKGTASSGEDSQPPSAGVTYEKPSFSIKKTLMAFETKTLKSNNNDDDDDDGAKRVEKAERPVVRKLTNLNGFLNRQSSTESESSTPVKPLAVKRSESLMLRLKKYESRIAGEQVVDDDSDEDENNNKDDDNVDGKSTKKTDPKKLSIDLSSLKNQWETGDISKRQFNNDDDDGVAVDGSAASDNCNGYSPAAEKNEELIRIRQQLARKKSGASSSIRNIYENAIKEAQQTQSVKSHPSDLSALNGFSTTEIQQQLLQQNGSNESRKSSTSSSPNKDHFQLKLSNKANKLKERFEQGLINNSSYDDSEENDGDNERTVSKLEQIRQEKLEDLSIFNEGEIKAREARSMFQQIDRRLSAASGQKQSLTPNSRSLSAISASMQAKLQSQISSNSQNDGRVDSNHLNRGDQGPVEHQKPIRLMNNVRT